MTDITPELLNPQVEGTRFRSAVSENLIQTIAGAQTFLNYFTYAQKQFYLNGIYSSASPIPFIGADGMAVFEFDTQIIDVWMYRIFAGSSGTTSLDIQLGTTSGGSFSSIFTTLPAITFQAPNFTWVGAPNPSLIGSQYSPPAYVPPAFTTAPVLDSSITNFIPAGSAIYCNLQSAELNAQNTGILIHYRNI